MAGSRRRIQVPLGVSFGEDERERLPPRAPKPTRTPQGKERAGNQRDAGGAWGEGGRGSRGRAPRPRAPRPPYTSVDELVEERVGALLSRADTDFSLSVYISLFNFGFIHRPRRYAQGRPKRPQHELWSAVGLAAEGLECDVVKLADSRVGMARERARDRASQAVQRGEGPEAVSDLGKLLLSLQERGRQRVPRSADLYSSILRLRLWQTVFFDSLMLSADFSAAAASLAKMPVSEEREAVFACLDTAYVHSGSIRSGNSPHLGALAGNLFEYRVQHTLLGLGLREGEEGETGGAPPPDTIQVDSGVGEWEDAPVLGSETGEGSPHPSSPSPTPLPHFPCGVPFRTETDLRFVASMATPDVIFDRPRLIDGRAVGWVEVKATYGSVQTFERDILAQLSSYRGMFGPGLCVFAYGFHPSAESLLDQVGLSDVVLCNWVWFSTHKAELGWDVQ
ncbi:protein of unknown function with TPD sequence-motif [Kipferlia bialata]|uniref:CDAN1-interacting nuclease 1 n=1 Tax=Kipferlia bialata TaxID=797122 RepID=A0A391NGW9_9EUKA|nr:protein of unknown function with TPD sequence-motif [Kipferlia bialata]|eukprot:g108.t1